MVEIAKSVLYVGADGAHSSGRERALVAGGIGVASVEAPEAAVAYVKNLPVRVVLLDDSAINVDLSSFAGSLKIARPFLKVVALLSAKGTPR